MGHISGQQDADLHNEDGTHRSTPPSADGRVLELWQSRIERHMAAHRHEQGAAMVEYTVLLGFAAAAMCVALCFMGHAIVGGLAQVVTSL